jgi:superfamily II DNA or RNA helicase
MTFLPPPVSLAPPELITSVVFDGRRLGLQLHYVEGIGKQLAKAGAWWCASRRMWTVEHRGTEQTLAWLSEIYQGHLVDLGTGRPELDAAFSSVQLDYFTQVLDVQIFPLAKGDFSRGRHAVSFAYDGPCIKAMRSLRGLFQRHASAWQVQGDCSAILQALQEVAGVQADFVFVHEQPVVLEDLVDGGSTTSLIKVPAAAPEFGEKTEAEAEGRGFMSAELDANVECPVDETALALTAAATGLRDYQVAGVRHLIRQSGACLGDDMGLGKSRQTVVATRMAAGAGRVLILCPASLRINWEREIHAVYRHAKVGLVGEDRIPMLYGCDFVIANYERLGGLVRETGLEFAVMAVDEAHYLKEHQAGRTRNAFVMASRIPRRYVVTGTPLLNREIELHTLLRLTGHRLGLLPLKEFRKEFTGGPEKRAHLATALHGWMLRRRKNVMKELGTKSRQVRYISPAEGLDAYQAIYRDMRLQAMPKIGKLRQCIENLKTQFLIETVESLAEGDKIIIFCQYIPTVDALKMTFSALRIGVVTLIGSHSPATRQKAVDEFQTNPAVTVFITTVAAGGVGITLTAANYVAFASLPWTPAQLAQAEDRAHRMGQLRNVISIIPLISQTIDDGVWNMLGKKQQTAEDVVEAVVADLPA